MIFAGLATMNQGGTEASASDEVSIGDRPHAGYVKFDGVTGECEAPGYVGWSYIQGFSQGQSKDDLSGSSRRRAEVNLEDITITKELDKASPKIAEAVCKGTNYPKVEIVLTKIIGDAGSVVYYQYELINVQVTSYHIASEDVTKEYPGDTITLGFEEIKVTYTEYDDDGGKKGTVEYSWKKE
jgi:type VI secretion system secreted protein Hcp